MQQVQRNAPALSGMCLLLLLAGLLLPWLVAPSAAMTVNAYDLAEWASLHPAQAQTSPPLLASLLLRVQVVALCALLGCLADGMRMRIATALFIVILAIAQLPPVEFVHDLGSLNYRQQFGCALASLTGLGLLPWAGGRWRGWIVMAGSAIGGSAAMAGMTQALDVYGQVGGTGEAGAGVWLSVAAYVCLAGSGMRHITNPEAKGHRAEGR